MILSARAGKRKVKARKIKYLKVDERERLRETLKNYKTTEGLMIEFLLTFGMRNGELLDLRKGDVDLVEKTIFVHGTKNSDSREFVVGKYPELWARLVFEVAKCKTDEDRVFPMTRMTLTRAWHKVRPTKHGLHSLRHTLSIDLLERGVPLQLVQRILGHKCIQTTMIYQDYLWTKKDFEKVFAGPG
jgi:integrase/recombinase XerD